MTERRRNAGGGSDAPVPRDLPDQQAGDERDRWDAEEDTEREAERRAPDESVPDVDEAGAGPRGAARSGGVHPEQPVPDEPSG